MAASRFSSDVLQLFCGPIPQEKKLSMDGFVCGKWTSQKATRTKADFCNRAKNKTRFTNLIEKEIASLGNIKTQFGLLVKFSIIRDLRQYLDHYFYRLTANISANAVCTAR